MTEQHAGWVSPPFCRHLMTIEGTPRDELSGDEAIWFLSRCICGDDIPPGPYEQTERAIRDHLIEFGLLQVTAPEPEPQPGGASNG